jgi:hypothetical protein
MATAAGADFGTAVHAWLAKVEWGDAATVAAAAAEWPANDPAAAEALACLRAPELAAVWARPDGAAEVKRERGFELVTDEAWISGAIDRLVVVRDAAGRPQRASVYDFKTDAAETEAELADLLVRYGAQLGFYRQAAAALTGVPPGEVVVELVLTRLRRRISL